MIRERRIADVHCPGTTPRRAPPDGDRPDRTVVYRTDAPALTRSPCPSRSDSNARRTGRGSPPSFPTGRSLRRRSGTFAAARSMCEFEDAHDIRAADAVRDEPSEPFDWQPGEGGLTHGMPGPYRLEICKKSARKHFDALPAHVRAPGGNARCCLWPTSPVHTVASRCEGSIGTLIAFGSSTVPGRL